MRRTVELDADLEAKLEHAASLAKQDPAVVLLQAVRLGLPTVSASVSAPRPEGFFADAYADYDRERLARESAMANVWQQPER